jgi:alpha-beta hydrolase superfamily lysophospholipase
MNMTEPMCIIGASMGGAIVCMFAIKYPEYISMICLLAPVGKFDAFDIHG